MKPKSKFRQTIRNTFITLIVLLMSMNFIKHTAFYETLDRNFFGFFSMLRYGLIEYPIQTVGNVANDIATMWDVRYENDSLREKLGDLYRLEGISNAQKEEIDRLKALLDLNKSFTEHSLINGSVVTRSIEQWDNAVTLNIGSNDGVNVGDGVISEYGIVGRVIEVTDNTSSVNLISANNDNSKVAVRMEISSGNFVQGILDHYDSNTNVFTVNLLEQSSQIVSEVPVTTSGIGGVYSAGLPVGFVDRVENIADGMGMVVYVKSYVNYSDIRYVSVVKLP
ncbi:rod shape-determining protein MreC [Erysipelothrix sp. HDW6A]|uniref:rod shape-determining protein MreC n=1 Tax=Erysipelothrix sp. HDW6A TaxID=2714928 RepID=UPI00140DEAB6|nr:rod shape-determining protein MreC [Erysipelothrix sp. HDW6A]QIK57410.1 rod shape-determining protein MreC [Erysipelothrix sp. HDW6A]